MNLKFIFAVLSLAALSSACSTMKVTSDRAPDHDFTQIATYQWIKSPIEIPDAAGTGINGEFQKALNTELAKRGLKQVMTLEEADVQVAYYVKLKEEVEYTTSENPNDREFSGGFVYSQENSGWSYEEREPDINVYAAEIGTLSVLVYDTASGGKIWQGNLKTRVDRSLPEEQQQKRIHAAAEKLIQRFP